MDYLKLSQESIKNKGISQETTLKSIKLFQVEFL